MNAVFSVYLSILYLGALKVTAGYPNCTRAVCYEPCEPDIGPDGCYSICSCPQLCKDIKCGENEVCRRVIVYCIRAPCFPIPSCVSTADSCTGEPNRYRCVDYNEEGTRWTYNSTTGSCDSFYFNGCTPSPNTFYSRNQCMAKCSTEYFP